MLCHGYFITILGSKLNHHDMRSAYLSIMQWRDPSAFLFISHRFDSFGNISLVLIVACYFLLGVQDASYRMFSSSGLQQQSKGLLFPLLVVPWVKIIACHELKHYDFHHWVTRKVSTIDCENVIVE